jgi:transposase
LPKLSRDELVQVEHELLRGAEANGYAKDVSTLKRVAEVIERLTGVCYHPAHVWSILRHELKWSGSDRHAEPPSAMTKPSTHGRKRAGRN